MSNAGKHEVAQSLQRAAARYVERAVQVAVDIMSDDTYKAADRLTAVKFIADRAAGKASQEIIHDIPDDDEFIEQLHAAETHSREILMLPKPTETPVDTVVPFRKRRRIKV